MRAVLSRKEGVNYSKPAPFELNVLTLAEKWGCRPSEVLEEDIEWALKAIVLDQEIQAKQNKENKKQQWTQRTKK